MTAVLTMFFVLVQFVSGGAGPPGVSVASLDAARRALASALPGDRVELASGVYEGSLWVEGVRGSRERPVVLAGADPSSPPVIRGRSECVHLSGCEWITVEGLILEGAWGNGINADDAGRRDTAAMGITIRSVTVRDIGGRGGDGNHDGIKLSGLGGFVVERCTIERWGGGGSGIDVVGCFDGRIAGCTLRHGDSEGSSGVQLKGGTRNVVVEGCRFEHAGRRALNIGGSTGLEFFRPRPQGFEARDILVEGCTIIGSQAAVAFVGVDGATVRRCTIVDPRRWVLRILQETREPGFVACRGGRMTGNLIVFDTASAGRANIGDATDAASFVFERNFWYCSSEPGLSRPELPSAETGGEYGKDPGFVGAAAGDYTPAPDGPAAGFGAHRR